jgi:hypothetical protein
MRFLTVAYALVLWSVIATPAQACLWDRDTNSRERQFKSQYKQDAATDYTPQVNPPSTWEIAAVWAMYPAGALLLIGSARWGFSFAKGDGGD